jgi:uncharacterized protein (TIRG00374 family)
MGLIRTDRLQLRKRWRFYLGIVLSLIALLWLVFTTNWSETWEALKTANYLLVLAAVALNLISIPLRSWRWWLMFPPEQRPGFQPLTTIMLIGQAINVFAPFRLGDFVRASLVEGQHAAFVMGTQVLRIALDLFILAGLVIVLLFQVQLPPWWRGPGELLLVTAIIVLLILVGVAAGRNLILHLVSIVQGYWPFMRGRHWFTIVAEFLRSLDIFGQRRRILSLFGLSLLIWAFYAAVNYLVLGAVGAAYSWLAALFLLAVLQLGIAIPSSPGRVGVYHYLAVQALAVFAVSQSTSVSYAVLLHLISVILPAALGMVLAWRSGLGSTEQQIEQEIRTN